MDTAFTSPAPTSIPPYREALPPEMEIRCRILVWCAAWGSVNGTFRTTGLRDIAGPGHIHMASGVGPDTTVSVSLDAYAAFWSSRLTESYADWTLIADGPIGVHMHNGMAAADFSSRLHGTTRTGQRMEQRQRVLQVWEKVERDWRLTQEQTQVNGERIAL